MKVWEMKTSLNIFLSGKKWLDHYNTSVKLMLDFPIGLSLLFSDLLNYS